MKKLLGLALVALMLVGCSSNGGGSASTVKCSGTMSGLDTTVNIEFDKDEKLAGLEMKLTYDAGSEDVASQFEGRKSDFASSMGLDEDVVSLKVDGSKVNITVDMDRKEMEDSTLFGNVNLDDSKENIVKSIEDDAGLTCKE